MEAKSLTGPNTILWDWWK